MNKKLVIILFTFFFVTSVYSEDTALKLRSDFTYKGSEDIIINATALVDVRKNKNFKNNIQTLVAYSRSKSSQIAKNNKNRKSRTKYKGTPEEIFKDFARSVVYIINEKDNAVGSGFVINYEGLKIITNWHVVESSKNVMVCLKTENIDDYCVKDQYTGKVIKTSKRKDLAMIEVKGLPTNLRSVSYGSYKNVRIGETVFAIGHPDGLLWSFTNGMVSQIRPNHNWRYKSSSHYANVIQTQTPINPGNSGGPLFNKRKKLVGINTFTAEGENLNFAISVDDLKEFIISVNKEDLESPWIKKKKKKGNTWIQKKSDKNKTKDGITKKYPDAIKLDANKNGTTDIWLIDSNKNGFPDTALFDLNEDQIIEAVGYDENENENYELILFDDDLNGHADRADYDENDDGTSDVIAYDFNQDGEWDKFEEVG